MVVEAVAKKKNLEFESGKLVRVAKFQLAGQTIYLLKPTTFMNLSGDAVKHWVQQTGTDISKILVITDDLALPFGTIRIKSKGSAGGHNGLTDIELKLKSQEYVRMRMGISSDFPKGQQVTYVLGKFDGTDADHLNAWLEKASEAVLCFCSRGLERTMNLYNGPLETT